MSSTSFPSIGQLPKQQTIPKKNLELVTLNILPDQYIIDAEKQSTPFKKTISIDRMTGKISQKLETNPTKIPQKCVKYTLFLGVLPIFNKKFLVFVENVRQICTIDKSAIYQIQSLGYVSLGGDNEYLEDKWNTIVQYMSYLNTTLMAQGYYFSFGYDLSISKIRFAEGYPFNFKFCWNAHLGINLISLGWFIPVIQGFVGNFKVEVKSNQLQYIIISRRSWKRGGTRYNSRGVGRKGNVANFCQTQQIVYYDTFCCSHVQIRGSVPTYWKQTGVYATVQFTHTKQQNFQACKTHFLKIINQYDMIMVVNLLSKSKPQQHQLTLYFEQMIKQKGTDNVRYEYFDFHEVCKNQRFDKSVLILERLGPINQAFGFYAEDLSSNQVIETQKGVMRTNCLDCLDRTNFIQSKLAMHTLDRILVRLGINLEKDIGYKDLQTAFDDLTSTRDLIINLRNIWADNGDMISIHYTGTPSTHTNILRSGKRNFAGSVAHTFVSINRFIKQNMTDSYKQQVIDILLGDHVQTSNYNELQNRLKSIYQNEDEQ